jgi:hypothetical protein
MRLFGKELPKLRTYFIDTTPHYNPIAEAQALVDSGAINGHEDQDPRFKKLLDWFAQNYMSVPTNDMMVAVQTLIDARSQHARIYRNSVGAVLFGDALFQDGRHTSSIIEHGLAYLNGYKPGLIQIANYAEGHLNSRDAAGIRESVTELNAIEPGVPLYTSYDSDLTSNAWNENPEIAQILRGDLAMYRALILAEDGRRGEAYARYSEAMSAGVSSRMDTAACYKKMFIQPVAPYELNS